MESTATEIILKNIEREIKEFKSSYAVRNLEIDARFEKIDAKFEGIDSKFENIDSRFEKIDNKFDQMNNKIDKLTERIHRNEMKVYGVSLVVALAASAAIRYFLA